MIDNRNIEHTKYVLEQMRYIALREWHWETETRRYLDYLVDIGYAIRGKRETVQEYYSGGSRTINIIRYKYKG